MVKDLPANAEDMGLISDSGGSHMPQTTKPRKHSY